ncbi:hypothetical protein ACP4OV_018487 [Aristida adscensionis]
MGRRRGLHGNPAAAPHTPAAPPSTACEHRRQEVVKFLANFVGLHTTWTAKRRREVVKFLANFVGLHTTWTAKR